MQQGWSGGAMVLGKLPVGQGPTLLAVRVGGVVWAFFLSSIVSFYFLPLYRLKYCLKGLLSSKQPTNQII